MSIISEYPFSFANSDRMYPDIIHVGEKGAWLESC